MIAPRKDGQNRQRRAAAAASGGKARKENARLKSRFLWVCVVVVAIVGCVWLWHSGEEEKPVPQVVRHNKQIKAESGRLKKERNDAGEMPAIPIGEKPLPPVEVERPVGNVTTARTAKVGRVMTLMDGTVVTNRVERPFKRDLEHSLWVALRPGNMGAGLLTTLQNRHSEEEIISMLKEMTVPEEGDSEGTIRIKQEVQELKERILLALDSGRTLDDVFNEIRNQGVAESMVKAETMRMRAEAIKTGDAEHIRETVRRTNEVRAEHGLEPLEVPAGFQEELPEDGEEDEAGNGGYGGTYQEFEDD